MNKSELFQTISIRWKEFDHFDENNWINLAKLGYEKYSEFNLNSGRWQIFLLKKKSEIEMRDQSHSIQFFFAIFFSKTSGKQFPISGIIENVEDLISGLRIVSSLVFTEDLQGSKKLFRFPRILNTENAQDYGYVRGLAVGIVLMFLDIIPWNIGNFRPSGILTTFLDYTRIVYYGTPGFAIIVGMAAIGIYFTVLFILIPIIFGNFCVFKARKIQSRRVENLPEFLFDCEFGKDAESSLNDQYHNRIENIKKEETYRKALSCWNNFKKEDFYELYKILKDGFCTAENLYDILCRITKLCPDFDIKKFLEIMRDVSRRSMQIVIKISDKQEKTS